MARSPHDPLPIAKSPINGTSQTLGRIEREGVTWDDANRFRPTADVEESETRTDGISLDWVYTHWPDIPLTTGTDTTVSVRLLDHDLWLGRVVIGDRDGFSIVYMSDAQTINYWRSRAHFDWGLQGIAMWQLSLEDVRMWETIAAGEYPPDTKRLDG